MNYMSRVGIDFKVVKKNAYPSTDNLILSVCNYYKISKAELLGEHRFRTHADARAILSYLLYRRIKMQSVDVGKLLNLNHSSILYHAKKVEGMMEVDKNFRCLVNEFKYY